VLDRNKVVRQLSTLVEKIFPDLKNQSDVAEVTFNIIAHDSLFMKKVDQSQSSFLLPFWDGNLQDTYEIKKDMQEYTVLSCDGSQIYPDRNMGGARCFLINLGGCFLHYSSTQKSKASFFSTPKIFLPQDILSDEKMQFSMDLVDLKREELELKTLFEKAIEQKSTNPICLVDGTLIFWFLEGKQPDVKEFFLAKYLYWLNKFYEEKIPVAGYISFPKSREIVNLIRLGLCRFDFADCIVCHKKYQDFPCTAVDNVIDTHVLRSFLQPGHRSTIFWSNSKIVNNYPEQLKPCFFYVHVGQEIVRIETVRWVVERKDMLEKLCAVAFDQSVKGCGYPVVISESHEQAVVKGPDRDFFYHVIQKIGIEQQRRFFVSQKSLKKRRMGV